MDTIERKKVMHIRKHRKKWQCIVRCRGHVVIQSFESKSDARSWGEKTSSELRNGSYQNSDKLISMTLKDLLQLYLGKIFLMKVAVYNFSTSNYEILKKILA